MRSHRHLWRQVARVTTPETEIELEWLLIYEEIMKEAEEDTSPPEGILYNSDIIRSTPVEWSVARRWRELGKREEAMREREARKWKETPIFRENVEVKRKAEKPPKAEKRRVQPPEQEKAPKPEKAKAVEWRKVVCTDEDIEMWADFRWRAINNLDCLNIHLFFESDRPGRSWDRKIPATKERRPGMIITEDTGRVLSLDSEAFV